MSARGSGAGGSTGRGIGTRPAAPGGKSAALRARLTELVEPVTQDAGFDLERVVVSRVGRRHLVRVTIDSDDGVGLDAIAEVSRAVSAALDAAEEAGPPVVPGEYVLEVSSPGVDRPLTEPRHWRRNIGRLVTVPVAGESAARTGGQSGESQPERPAGPVGRRLSGRIAGADASGVLLEVDGTPHRLPYERLGPGRVRVELQRLDPDTADEEELGGQGT